MSEAKFNLQKSAIFHKIKTFTLSNWCNRLVSSQHGSIFMGVDILAFPSHGNLQKYSFMQSQMYT